MAVGSKPCQTRHKYQANIDICKIKVETEPYTFCKNFTNIERVELDLPTTDVNADKFKFFTFNLSPNY